ncbi:DUF1329 domain-containing protein [Zoogloea sp.]|uniref:DUF1329 domain-containing protein n=1 Tax=Zoogloea sp. TaxID=49181 RepID=UPI0026094F79|nr:DUF1329 domain-containing protein [Zoogloea sp.]MDD3352079.1 DUF1329 domain-containing protein [Zoogloea sp.]
MHARLKTLAVLVGLTIAGTASAAVTAEEAKKLGTTLTPWGAEIAGNKDGTIPAYTGGLKNPPPSYDPAKPGIRPDPFANEKPLLSITPANYTQHADKLSEGQKAMFKKYATFRMDVFPSHRTFKYPKAFLDNSIKNATSCKLTADGLGLENCWGGTPFPIPKNGSEMMWNRILKFQAYSFGIDDAQSTVVDVSGNKIDTSGWSTRTLNTPFDPKRSTPLGSDEMWDLRRMDYHSPVRKAGEKLVIHDSLDMNNVGRKAWTYLAGQRRIKLSPDVGYDTPSPTGAGIGTVDDSSLFFGQLDRYNFKLVGKKELYIPYNMYKIQDQTVCGRDVVLTKQHLNPDCVRWELHRVWVVEATLKEGKRHIYPRRTFYFDEDLLGGAGVAESYDASGAIYRFVQMHPTSFYEAEGGQSEEFTVYDLQTGSYVRQAYSLNKTGWVVTKPMPSAWYTPEALAGSGVK